MARLIINLRGPNGAGKTTLARGILACKEYDCIPLEYISHSSDQPRPRKCPVAKCVVPGIRRPVYVVGRYDVQQGGCDTEKDMDAIEDYVSRATNLFVDGHVFFEGFVVSKSGERWLQFSTRVKARGWGEYLWLFLEPDLQTLERRIKERNGGKDIKLDRLQNTVDCVASIRRKARQISRPEMVVSLNPNLPQETVFHQMVVTIAERESL